MNPLHLQPAAILPSAVHQLAATPGKPYQLAPNGRTGLRVNQLGLQGVITPDALVMFRAWLQSEIRDDRGPLVLRLNSPGGLAEGVAETAELVRRVAKVREVVAIAEGYCCSACYHIASPATKIIATPSTIVGSCGTIIVLVDESAAVEAAGVKFIPITTAPAKTHGMAGLPATEEAIEAIRQMVAGLNFDFELSLEKSGRMTRPQINNALEGHVYVARDAKAQGMVDRVALAEDVLAELNGSQPERYEHLSGYEAADKFYQLVCKRAGTEMLCDASDSIVKKVAAEFPHLEAAFDEQCRHRALR